MPGESVITAPRTFIGFRPEAPAEYRQKGISNGLSGADYEGVIFSDGTVVIRWLTAYRSHSVWGCWEDFYQVHGHPEYGTEIEFHDGGDAPVTDEARKIIRVCYLDGATVDEIAREAGVSAHSVETYLLWWCDRGCPDDPDGT